MVNLTYARRGKRGLSKTLFIVWKQSRGYFSIVQADAQNCNLSINSSMDGNLIFSIYSTNRKSSKQRPILVHLYSRLRSLQDLQMEKGIRVSTFNMLIPSSGGLSQQKSLFPLSHNVPTIMKRFCTFYPCDAIRWEQFLRRSRHGQL